MIKKLRYILENIIFKIFLFLFFILGLKKAANFGSFLAKFIGRKLKVNQLAYENISNALPALNHKEISDIIINMWDNLGRIAGEYVHISRMEPKKLAESITLLKDSEKNIKQMQQSQKGGIIMSAHIGNWELGPKFFLGHDITVKALYRPLNNPYVEKQTAKMRSFDLIKKSAKGGREIIDNIKKGEYVVILADQKTSEGEKIKFFDQDAVTTTSIARIALKYDVPIIPVRSIRLNKKFEFAVEVEKPLDIDKKNDVNSEVLKVTRDINKKLESWIKEYPSQWFWVHNRWKS